MIRKRAEVHPDWLIGLLTGIMVASILVVLGIQWYATTQKPENSFGELVTKIQELKDGESTFMSYTLPDGSLLVSFSAGEDFNTKRTASEDLFTEESCTASVQIPESCGDAPCLCFCDGSYKYGYENACIEEGKCHSFITEKDLSFADTDCDAGVYREGPDNGIFTLFLKREGNTINFCSTKDCPPKEEETKSEESRVAVTENSGEIFD